MAWPSSRIDEANGYLFIKKNKNIMSSLRNLLTLPHILLTIVIALSIFNLMTFLWLALTVWLNGDRGAWITRLGFVGLSFSALFFFIHTLLISGPLGPGTGLISQDVLWYMLWLPAICVPYIWFAIGLHYASLINAQWRRRRPYLLLFSGLLGCYMLLMLIVYRSIFTFTGTMRLLAFGDLGQGIKTGISLAPTLPLLFLFYVAFCAIGPWITFGRVFRLIRTFFHEILSGSSEGTQYIAPHGAGPDRARAGIAPTLSPRLQTEVEGRGDAGHRPGKLRHALANAFWDDPTEIQSLEEPHLSWHLARPGLLAAAILMAVLTTILGVLGIWSLSDWFKFHQHIHILPPLTSIPTNLLILDFCANGTVALIILLIGYSIVRHGILIERPLARRGFFEQWRGIVIVATAAAIFIALLFAFTHTHLGSLLLITALATGVYALFTWSSYTAHDRYIALLGPFLRSTNMRHWLNTDAQKTEQGLETLFFHLCKDVLAVECACLTVLTGSVRRNFSYRWPLGLQETQHVAPTFPLVPLSQTPANGNGKQPAKIDDSAPVRVRITIKDRPMICWVLPIYDELGLVALLYLGPREDGGTFTDEDMELARACGQRILDTLSDHEAMQAVSGLLRRRIVNVKLLDAQHRRILHDDILPEMHLALLRLETLRFLLEHGPQHIKPDDVLSDQFSASQADNTQSIHPEQMVQESVEMISDAHRRLAAMMRATAPSAPHHLEHDGLMNAIHAMLEQDFRHAFDEVEWDVTEETAQCIDEVTPPAIAELMFAAVQEALRNAARHARGADVHRRLCITLKASCEYAGSGLELTVADDGVGILSASSSTSGTGGGLLTHNALLAVAGGSLTVKSAPGEGVTVRILLPANSLR
jgi:two-component sensor histidine kinase